MYKLIRKALFCLSAETAHDLAMDMIGAGERLCVNQLFAPKVISKPREVMGLTFNNPVGLAAGLDKNGDCIDGLGSLGFGFLELGTVTPVGQVGNPKPRMFRLPEKEAIINRMGFNNLGVDHLVNNVKKSHYSGVIGINIGKNLTTHIEEAKHDFLTCLRKVYPYADYVAVNLSSPNTPELRKLQFGEFLKDILSSLKEEQSKLEQEYRRKVPLAIKIAPDMTSTEITSIASELLAYELDGVIATNTTLDRDMISGFSVAEEVGGLSGRPLSNKSTEIISLLSAELNGKIPIIGVGGIMDAHTTADKIKAGSSLVQIYTGFIYHGSGLIREVAETVYSVE